MLLPIFDVSGLKMQVRERLHAKLTSFVEKLCE